MQRYLDKYHYRFRRIQQLKIRRLSAHEHFQLESDENAGRAARLSLQSVTF